MCAPCVKVNLRLSALGVCQRQSRSTLAWQASLIVTSGFAVVKHSAATASLLQQQAFASVSTNKRLRFTPIFQTVTKSGRLSSGDRKRGSYAGLPENKAAWCDDAAKAICNLAADIDLHSI